MQAMRKYGIAYYISGDRIVIPHYDINGNLIGIRGRAMKEEDLSIAKYMPLFINGKSLAHQLNFNLYGLYENKTAIKTLKKAIIFEGEKSVLKMYDYYNKYSCAVATCGNSISNYQRDLLISLGVDEVIIAYDKEYSDHTSEKAKKYGKDIVKLAQKFLPYCDVSVLWDTNDLLDEQDAPVDKGKDIFEILVKNKIKIK